MKQRLQFLKVMYAVIFNKQGSWVFFRMNDEQQRNLLEGEDINISIKYINMDNRIIDLIAKRICDD